MRHWKGWADAKTLNQSKHTPSWFETHEASSWNWYHPWLKSQGVLMVLHDEFKYQPCPTIHYTYNEMMEGSSWCELPESVQSHTILVWSVGVCHKPNLYPSMTQNWVVVTILEPMYKSQPCITIHHTIDETLEGLSWCKDLESIQT